MKRKLRIILALTALLAAFFCTAALADASGSLSSSISWTLTDDGVLTITGTGAIPDYNPPANPSPFNNNMDITTVNIGDGITRIGEYSFYNCANLLRAVVYDSSPSFGVQAFGNNAPYFALYAPEGSTAQSYASGAGLIFRPFTGQCGDNVHWNLNAETGVITISGTGPMWNYDTGSNLSPFSLDTLITSAVVEYGVRSIGNWFFDRCSSLTSVSMSSSITGIGSSAFYSCNLAAVEIPDGVLEIGLNAFAYNRQLARADISPSVTEIGSNAFRYTALSEIMVPYAVTAIGDYAFGDCSSLAEATIAGLSVSISDTAFSGCGPGLTIRGYSGFSAQAFATEKGFGFGLIRCGDNLTANCSADGSRLYISGTGAMWDYGNGTGHRYSPFFKNSQFTVLSMADGVTSVGNSAFVYCSRLGTLSLPDSLSSIGAWTFQSCDALTSLKLPESVTVVEVGAFRYCSGLKSITVSSGVDKLYRYTFDGCSMLADITIRNKNLQFYTDNIFDECSSSLVLHGYPGSTTQTYANTNGITFVPIPLSGTCGPNLIWTLDADTGMLTIEGEGSMTDYDNMYTNTTSPFYANPDIRSVYMDYGVTTIGRAAFEDCTNLTYVELPINLDRIGSMAFYNCSLNGVLQIPFGTKTIGSSAFKFNPLTGAVIPGSVTEIEDSVFENCSSLYDVEIHNPSVQIGYNVFRNCSTLLTLKCFSGSTAETYANTFDLRAGRFKVGDNIICDMDGAGNVTISGSGPMYNYEFYTMVSPLYGQVAAKSAVISDGITSVGRCFFAYCSSLTDVSLPDGLLSLENDAFDYCHSLQNIELPETLTYIGSEAFMESRLHTAVIPMGVHYLGARAFAWCSELENVTIMDPGAEIADDAFDYCSSSLTMYGWTGSTTQAFALAHGFAFVPLNPEPDLVLPADLETIEEEAFIGVAAETVLIPDTVTTIIGDPFAGSKVTLIFGYAGSAAQTFAEEYGYGFVAVTE